MTFDVYRNVSAGMIGVVIIVVLVVVSRMLQRFKQGEATIWTKVATWAVPVVLLAAFSVPPFALQYRLDETHIAIRTVTGQQQVPYVDIRSASPIDYTLGTRLLGMSSVAYHVGHYNVNDLGSVRVFAGASSGRGVLIETADGNKVLLSPVEADQFVAALQSYLP